jgi:hypothetical protein
LLGWVVLLNFVHGIVVFGFCGSTTRTEEALPTPVTPAIPVAFCNAFALCADEKPADDFVRFDALAPAAINS